MKAVVFVEFETSPSQTRGDLEQVVQAVKEVLSKTMPENRATCYLAVEGPAFASTHPDPAQSSYTNVSTPMNHGHW